MADSTVRFQVTAMLALCIATLATNIAANVVSPANDFARLAPQRRLDLDALYDEAGEYRYTRGVSVVAIVALVAGVLPSLPGFLEEVKLLSPDSVSRPLAELYHLRLVRRFRRGLHRLSGGPAAHLAAVRGADNHPDRMLTADKLNAATQFQRARS